MRPLTQFLLFAMLALILGLGTAWHMIRQGTQFTKALNGPWESWYLAGNPQADPYTRAHFVHVGTLPITTTNARYFTARRDNNDEKLKADCTYLIEGENIRALWWSLAVYDQKGRVFSNKAQRYAYSNRNIFLERNNDFKITLAHNVQTGNWLPLNGDSAFILVLRVYQPEQPFELNDTNQEVQSLPKITRVKCD